MKIINRGGHAILTFPVTYGNLKILREIPAEFRFAGSGCVFNPTPEAIRYIYGQFPWIEGLDQFETELETANEAMTKGAWKIEWTPYAHQKEAFEAAYNERDFMLRMGVQTGKSAIALWEGSWLSYSDGVDAVIIVAPSGVHQKWIEEEFPKFWPDCVPAEAAFWSSTMRAEEKRKFEAARRTTTIPVLAFNIEAFSTASRKAEKIVESILRQKRCFFILDESHTIKSPAAKRTRALQRLGKFAAYRRTLTGTAGPPLDYYSQYNFLDRNILGFSTYQAFKSHFAVMVNLPGKTDRRGRPIQIVAVDQSTGRKKYKNIPYLKKLIEPYTYTIATEECNDLPPKIYATIPVELTKEQRRLYEDIRNDLIIEFEGNEISAPLAIQKMVRLRQIIGGFLPDENGEAAPINKTNRRVEQMIDKIDLLDGPLIIWASFRAEIEMIGARLREEYGERQVVLYYGGDKRDAERARFQAGDARFFVSNPACGGVGFSLYVAHQMIFYSNGYDLKQRLQAEGRVLAKTQASKKCIFLDMIADNTLDERVLSALLSKYEVESQLTGTEALKWLR